MNGRGLSRLLDADHIIVFIDSVRFSCHVLWFCVSSEKE